MFWRSSTISVGHDADARRELGAHGLEERVVVLGRMMTRHLERQHELLAALGADAERGRVARTQVRVAALRRELDVVRIEVPPLEDDEILQPAGDEELAVAQRRRGRPCAGTVALEPARRAPKVAVDSCGRPQ